VRRTPPRNISRSSAGSKNSTALNPIHDHNRAAWDARVQGGKRMPFFIDEDPLEASEVTLRVAGLLPFIPGKKFKTH